MFIPPWLGQAIAIYAAIVATFNFFRAWHHDNSDRPKLRLELSLEIRKANSYHPASRALVIIASNVGKRAASISAVGYEQRRRQTRYQLPNKWAPGFAPVLGVGDDKALHIPLSALCDKAKIRTIWVETNDGRIYRAPRKRLRQLTHDSRWPVSL